MEETELSSQDDVIADGRHLAAKHASKEGWYGAILLAGTVLFGAVLLGGGLWWAYTRIYLDAHQEKASIVRLPSDMPASGATDTETDPAVVPVAIPSAPASGESAIPADAKQESISVLNGGGAKGSAGTAAALLKQDGYAKVTTGNTTKDYTGVTVYHAAGKGESAAAVVKVLLKQYPKATSKEAPKTDAEASSGTIVIIIGK